MLKETDIKLMSAEIEVTTNVIQKMETIYENG